MRNQNEFIFVEEPSYHILRRRLILESHPEIKLLSGNYYPSAFYIILIVLIQLSLSFFFNEYAWWIIFILAYAIGAFFHHALYVMIHECTHNLVFKSSFGNKIMGLICDIPLVLPSSMGFRTYHMIHHKHLGEYLYDPDITSYTEGKFIGKSALKKALWLCFFSISQALRPLKVKYYKPLNRWTVFNTILNLIINILIYRLIGLGGLFYLSLSTFFALGLHPLGGRWIQEHFITHDNQETYSYYGPLNKLCFNMGYHNEHHDFMNIAWINQPKITKLAPEFYNNLHSYNSWTKVLINFIFNKNMDSFSRIIHPNNDPLKINDSNTKHLSDTESKF